VKLRLGLSPCPNDTFIFHALLHGLVDTGGVEIEPVMADVEELNDLMARGAIEATKASFAAFARYRDAYAALRTGGALGRGNGPLIVAREPLSPAELAGRRVLLPGDLTTAALLFRTFHPEVSDTASVRYYEAPRALDRGDADAAVIIHELRFTYAERGFHRVEDLGQRFEDETGLPVALGGIFVRRDVDPDLALRLEAWIGASLDVARRDPALSRDYVRAHAQELQDGVTSAHIDLYVNAFSAGYGEEGEAAIRGLVERAVEAGAAPASPVPLFVARGT
jgi:1,4-dihydroxy-6-naphthoate synthase